MADGLDSTLSTNIHHYSRYLITNDNQWDAIPVSILHAITENLSSDLDGNAEWDQA